LRGRKGGHQTSHANEQGGGVVLGSAVRDEGHAEVKRLLKKRGQRIYATRAMSREGNTAGKGRFRKKVNRGRETFWVVEDHRGGRNSPRRGGSSTRKQFLVRKRQPENNGEEIRTSRNGGKRTSDRKKEKTHPERVSPDENQRKSKDSWKKEHTPSYSHVRTGRRQGES